MFLSIKDDFRAIKPYIIPIRNKIRFFIPYKWWSIVCVFRQRADTSEIVDLYTAGADDIVSIVGAAPNPFNITAEDEDNEFQEEDMTTG